MKGKVSQDRLHPLGKKTEERLDRNPYHSKHDIPSHCFVKKMVPEKNAEEFNESDGGDTITTSETISYSTLTSSEHCRSEIEAQMNISSEIDRESNVFYEDIREDREGNTIYTESINPETGGEMQRTEATVWNEEKGKTLNTTPKRGYHVSIQAIKTSTRSDVNAKQDFFDRMSKTDTFASADMKGKINRSATKLLTGAKNGSEYKGNKRKTLKKSRQLGNDLSQRMTKTETFASTDMKGKLNNSTMVADKNKISQSRVNLRHNGMDNFFDRMSKADTFASADMKGKINRSSKSYKMQDQKDKKVSSDFFNRMSKTDTFASADMKGKNDRSKANTTTEPSSAGLVRKQTTLAKKSRKVESGFFDRMSKAETFASADLKGKRHISAISLKLTTNTSNIQTTYGFFDRLSKTHTASSAEKDINQRDIKPHQ